jgi:Fur family transcriptional regulator, ferric uptake regulator
MILNNKSSKRRQTRARNALLTELRVRRSHPSAEELFQSVRRRLRGVSLGTVYRNLDVLESEGLVRKVQTGEVARYDADLFDHDHLVCENCGAIEDVPSSVPPQAVKSLAAARGFSVQIVRTEFRGLCAGCGNRDAQFVKS